MHLGLEGRRALVCASSKGLGLACARSLASAGVSVILNGRDANRLHAAAQEVGNGATSFVADINDKVQRDDLIAHCGDIDILVNNNAGPPMCNWDAYEIGELEAALVSNLLVAVELIRAFVPGMRQRKFGRVVNITSAMVKSPMPEMTLSTTPRAALTAFSKAVARDVAKDNVTINNLLPERFATDRQAQMRDRMMRAEGISAEEAVGRIAQTIAAKRLGEPAELGDACAYLCSAQAGYISGQNLQLDGGSYAGLI